MNSIRQADFGTPERSGGPDVTLKIDGCDVTVAAGTSVMRAAALLDRPIPKLCATDTLEPFGSCRMCLVEIEGVKGTPASCTTPVTEGMHVSTQTPRLEKLRRGVMELYISDHPLDCLTCAANGDCELQDMAGVVGLREVRYGMDGTNHFDEASRVPVDTSTPYFQFDSAKCIACSRCIRACEEVQGTFALTMQGRGFASRISAGTSLDNFFSSECVSCGACVAVCPTATLEETAIVVHGVPTRSVSTTCAYCGVGCSFEAELKGDTLVRMSPSKSGGANEGHSCVKGRFAFGYASHKDRITTPMIRKSTADPWQPVSWDEAIGFAANRLKSIQAEHGISAIGGVTSSRCTNEEVFAVQKMIRTAFGNNNVDTCARVCHSPTGYGLKQTFGTSAGTQNFKSVEETDVMLLIGANPTDGHPVFASRMKKAMRAGARLIVIDPRRIDLVRSPHVEAAHHIPLMPGTNVAVMNALAHVIVTEGLVDEAFVAERCEGADFERWRQFAAGAENSPEALAEVIGVDAKTLRAAARLFAGAKNGSIYYGLGVTEHSQGSTMVMAMANLAMATGNIGRPGVGVNPLRGQNNVQGSCDMGSFPHELPGYRHVSDPVARGLFEKDWGLKLDPEPGLRIPNMFAAAIDGTFRGIFIQGEDLAQSDPNTQHVTEALGAMDCVIVQDLFLNETARYAHVFLPGTAFLEKDGTFTNAERRLNRVRPVMKEATGLSEWEIVCRLSRAMGYEMSWRDPAEILDEIARLTPAFAGVSHARLDAEGSMQWPVNENAPNGTPTMHVNGFVRGKGRFMLTRYVPTDERTTRRYPLILTTGRILSQYNVGAQTRRTENQRWHEEDVLEIHPHDAELRGIVTGQRLSLASRKGATTLTAVISERMPQGVVYTTFHHPVSGANVVTTDNSDWATNCPEYKVTAVEVRPANEPSSWQIEHEARRPGTVDIAAPAE
jgi:formate dehydrogenase major subunit